MTTSISVRRTSMPARTSHGGIMMTKALTSVSPLRERLLIKKANKCSIATADAPISSYLFSKSCLYLVNAIVTAFASRTINLTRSSAESIGSLIKKTN